MTILLIMGRVFGFFELRRRSYNWANIVEKSSPRVESSSRRRSSPTGAKSARKCGMNVNYPLAKHGQVVSGHGQPKHYKYLNYS
jgi:hypothetical protein